MQPLYTYSLELLNNKSSEISNYVKKYHKINFVLLGDSHLVCNDAEDTKYNIDLNGEQYEKILQHITNNTKIHPMFIIHGGDIVNAGDNDNSFEAFVEITKKNLFPKNIPIFVSIGNHDYDKYTANCKAFKSYIGPVRTVTPIPGTYIKYISLNTHFSDAPFNNYKAKFSQSDIDLLLKESNIPNNKYHYIIDFHTPIQNPPSFFKFNDHELSFIETKNFLKAIQNLKLIGIFCHHIHISHVTSLQDSNLTYSTPYIISGCGGNHNNNEDFSYYYVTVDTKKFKITNCKKYTVK